MTGVIVIASRGAEDAQRGVAFEFVDPATFRAGAVHHKREELVEHRDHLLGRKLLCERRRADQVDEQDACTTALPTELCPLRESVPSDLDADVAAEEIVEALALAQPGDHAVEPGLEHAHLTAVVDGNL